MGRERRGRGGEQNMIVVGADDGAHRNDGIAAGTILDHNRLTPALAQPIAKQTSAEVHAAAGPESHDELDRPLRPGLRPRWTDKDGKQKQRQAHSPSDAEHGVIISIFACRIRYRAYVYVSNRGILGPPAIAQ